MVGSFNPKEGQVELCYQNQWHSICSDSWNILYATVVCSTLGYSITQGIDVCQSVSCHYFSKLLLYYNYRINSI